MVAAPACWGIWISSSLGSGHRSRCRKGPVLVQPKDVEIVVDPMGQASILGREFLGTGWEYRVRSGDSMVRAICSLESNYTVHTPCRLRLKSDAEISLMAC